MLAFCTLVKLHALKINPITFLIRTFALSQTVTFWLTNIFTIFLSLVSAQGPVSLVIKLSNFALHAIHLKIENLTIVQTNVSPSAIIFILMDLTQQCNAILVANSALNHPQNVQNVQWLISYHLLTLLAYLALHSAYNVVMLIVTSATP